MNPFLSVRFRLFALCVGLLAVMGGANLLLGQINRQHEDQVRLLQEQYRRVSVINGVQHAVTSYRYWQGQVTATGMVNNAGAEQRARVKLNQALKALEERLTELSSFDPATVGVLKSALADLPKTLQEGVAALEKRDAAAESFFNEATRLLTIIDDSLGKAAAREQTLAEDAQTRARENAQTGIRLSIWIIAASSVFGLILSYLVLRSIVRPMQTTVRALRLVNAGETSIDLPPVSQDEFGDMAVALRQFRDQAEHLRRLAYRDPLTGIGNRAQLESSLQDAVDVCRENRNHAALFFIDLDNFRSVNDSLGHSAGDRYLTEAVERLQRFAPEDGVVCRYGGDKFAVLMQGIPAWDADTLQTHLRSIANQILFGMVEPYQIGADLLPMSVSIGISVFPGDGQTSEQLVSGAEAAMYLAKRSGRNNAQFASPELTGDARRHLAMVADIRRGLERDEFEPFYQPVVDVSDGRLIGAEALLRWKHPQRGLVGANDFIPAAEASGLIHALGERCMAKASEQLARWADREDQLRISVNLSARQIEDQTAIPFLTKLHRSAGSHVVSLDFEITETAILQHIDRAQETLRQIRALGHRLSIDDFGTGYSSLVYLQRFPINRIKVDRSFVSRVETSREAQAIISATVALGQSLDLEVVAEGVETIGQSRQLQKMGCTLQQGYYFTPALSAIDFDSWRTARLQAVPGTATA